MSTADLDLFGPPDEAEASPRFTTVLRGFDPEQVRNYMLQQQARIDAIEAEVEDMRGQRDQARRRYGMAREDAYNQLASRMAELLKVADAQADKIRREGEEEARRLVAEARQLSAQTVREAEAEAERLRVQGKEFLASAKSERERILGGLAASRDAAVAELLSTRDLILNVSRQLEVATAVAQQARTEIDGEEVKPPTLDEHEEDPDDGDLLDQVEGFEIMLPEFMAKEDPAQEPASRPETQPEPPAAQEQPEQPQ
jgi:hypothetical protein